MVMNPDLFKAILSMDAYNRGYNARSKGVTEQRSKGVRLN